jgi:hypothetical protein
VKARPQGRSSYSRWGRLSWRPPILMPALVLLLFAVSAALIRGGFSEPVAHLLTGAGAALISAVLIATGMSRLSGDALKPAVTLDQVQRDKVAAKEMVR